MRSDLGAQRHAPAFIAAKRSERAQHSQLATREGRPDTRRSSTTTSNNTRSSKPCNFFVRTGRCNNGHSCRYAHDFKKCSPTIQRSVLLGRQALTLSVSKRRTIALLHPGEMGISLAAALLRRGHQVVWCSNGRSSASRLRAESFGLVELSTLDQVVEVADVIISVCPPSAALQVATDVATAWATAVEQKDAINHRQRREADDTTTDRFQAVPPVYLEANAVSPETIKKIWEVLQNAGIDRIVDGCIIGPPGATMSLFCDCCPPH